MAEQRFPAIVSVVRQARRDPMWHLPQIALPAISGPGDIARGAGSELTGDQARKGQDKEQRAGDGGSH